MMVIPTQYNFLQGQLGLLQVAASLVNSLIDRHFTYLNMRETFCHSGKRARHFGVGGWSPVVEMPVNV